ncbi:MAG: hypothetical protein EBX41_09580 [Chitinophagia bacterium]|nr:hypothetical protein [Chitinophagia bacterium]
MPKSRIYAILTVLLTSIIAWVNVKYFNTEARFVTNAAIKEGIHYGSFLMVYSMGLLYWRHYGEAWVNTLWTWLYAATFALVIGLSAVYYLTHNLVILRVAAQTRATFISPLIFLVFVIIQFVAVPYLANESEDKAGS